MENHHMLTCQPHHIFCQDIIAFHAEIFFFVEKPLLLNSRHVENIKIRHGVLKFFHLLIWHIILFQHIVSDVVGYSQFLRRDKDKAYARISYKRFYQRMHCPAEFQIAA